nr:MAG TPA: hypothetical protein [Caudoviricetes sp.]
MCLSTRYYMKAIYCISIITSRSCRSLWPLISFVTFWPLWTL